MKKTLSLILVVIASLALVACGGGDKAKLAEAKDALEFLDVNLNQVTRNFELYTEGLHGTTITWESSNADVGYVREMENQTVLVADRPTADKGNIKVTLTATLTLGKETDTKEFEITVVALSADVVDVADIAEARERDEKGDVILKGKEVRIPNVVVANTDTDAYYVSDGKSVILVYGTPDGVLVGDKGTIVATVDDYYNSAQLTDASFVARGEGTVAPKDINLRDLWLEEKATDAEMKAAQQDPNNLQLVKFEALLLKRVDFTGGANYQLTLVGANEEGQYDISNNFVISYYKGLLDGEGKGELHNLNGKIVTVTATIRELRTNRITTAGKSQPVWSMSIKEIVSSKDPSTEVQAVVDSFITFKQDFVTEGTLTLPTTGAVFGSTLTWALKDETQSTLINPETGKVTPIEGERIEVVIVVSSVKDGKTATYEYVVFVGDYVDVTLAEFVEQKPVKPVRVTAVVTGSKVSTASSGKHWNYTIQDATGAITIFDREAANKNSFVVGREVVVVGSWGQNAGLAQLSMISAKLGKDEVDLPKDLDITNISKDDLMPHQSKLVELKNVEVTAVDDQKYTLILKVKNQKDEIIDVRWDKNVELPAEMATLLSSVKVGDYINLNSVVLSWFVSGQTYPVPGGAQIQFFAESKVAKVTVE